MTTIWIDGALCDAAGAIAAVDRGFVLGDGVFETLLVDRGRPAFFGPHMARMAAGAGALDLAAPDAGAVRDGLAALYRAHGTPERAALRVTLTRGSGPRGLAPPAEVRPRLLLSLAPSAPPTDAPMKLHLVSIRRNEGSPVSRLKTLSYLDSVLAKAEAAGAGADEAVMLNNQGRVASCAAGNILLLTEEGIATPPAEEGVLLGVVRGAVLAAARREGIAVAERPVDRDELTGAALLVTNSLIGVRRAGVDGAPHAGALSARLERLYTEMLDADLGEG